MEDPPGLAGDSSYLENVLFSSTLLVHTKVDTKKEIIYLFPVIFLDF